MVQAVSVMQSPQVDVHRGLIIGKSEAAKKRLHVAEMVVKLILLLHLFLILMARTFS